MAHPQTDSISLPGGTNGACVLLFHGFTATPDSLRPLINRLAEQGYAVEAPLLPGHGTIPENLALTGWQDWLGFAEGFFTRLLRQYDQIFVGGLSLGALLALKLAAMHPTQVDAIAALAVPLWLKLWARFAIRTLVHSPLKRFYKVQRKWGVDIKSAEAKKNFWNYPVMPVSCLHSMMRGQKDVVVALDRIVAPILLIHSVEDSTAPYHAMAEVARLVSSKVTETVTLKDCYHVITLDNERELVGKKVCEFFNRWLEDAAPSAANNRSAL